MRDLVKLMILSGLCLFATGVYAHEENEEEEVVEPKAWTAVASWVSFQLQVILKVRR